MPRVTPSPPEGDARHTSRDGLTRLALGGALLLTVPGLACGLAGVDLHDVVGPFVFGAAILGSAFLLAWGAEVLQLDVSQGLALTILALIAVLPEYAVDLTFAWKAGQD